MKLVILTALKEDQKALQQIMERSEITVFTITRANGFRESNSPSLLANWFGSGDDFFDSIFLFSFTDEKNANIALQGVVDYNSKTQSNFPIRAFILPVERAAY